MFRNRGSTPNINNNGYNAPHYSNYWNGRFIIIQYDKTFVAIELILTFIILVTAFSVYIFAYEVSFKDPIATMKNNFLTAQLIAIGISLGATGLVTFFTKSKENLIRNLRIIAIISMLIIIIFSILKVKMDNKYNEDTFGKFYEEYEQSNDNYINSNKVTVGLSGIKISSLKEAYIDESINAYTNFSIKTILYMIIHILVVMIIFYLSHRLSSIERKKEKLARDDAILYDEEENIKF